MMSELVDQHFRGIVMSLYSVHQFTYNSYLIITN